MQKLILEVESSSILFYNITITKTPKSNNEKFSNVFIIIKRTFKVKEHLMKNRKIKKKLLRNNHNSG